MLTEGLRKLDQQKEAKEEEGRGRTLALSVDAEIVRVAVGALADAVARRPRATARAVGASCQPQTYLRYPRWQPT